MEVGRGSAQQLAARDEANQRRSDRRAATREETMLVQHKPVVVDLVEDKESAQQMAANDVDAYTASLNTYQLFRGMGAKAEQIAKLPKRRVTEADDSLLLDVKIICHICKDCYSQGSEVSTTPCCHIFHLRCLERWLLSKGTCPLCRRSCRS
jgi:hypothetical protein